MSSAQNSQAIAKLLIDNIFHNPELSSNEYEDDNLVMVVDKKGGVRASAMQVTTVAEFKKKVIGFNHRNVSSSEAQITHEDNGNVIIFDGVSQTIAYVTSIEAQDFVLIVNAKDAPAQVIIVEQGTTLHRLVGVLNQHEVAVLIGIDKNEGILSRIQQSTVSAALNADRLDDYDGNYYAINGFNNGVGTLKLTTSDGLDAGFIKVETFRPSTVLTFNNPLSWGDEWYKVLIPDDLSLPGPSDRLLDPDNEFQDGTGHRLDEVQIPSGRTYHVFAGYNPIHGLRFGLTSATDSLALNSGFVSNTPPTRQPEYGNAQVSPTSDSNNPDQYLWLYLGSIPCDAGGDVIENIRNDVPGLWTFEDSQLVYDTTDLSSSPTSLVGTLCPRGVVTEFIGRAYIANSVGSNINAQIAGYPHGATNNILWSVTQDTVEAAVPVNVITTNGSIVFWTSIVDAVSAQLRQEGYRILF
jgi:regulator of extracellular matrix RemA (YlzA/DUF370 family)